MSDLDLLQSTFMKEGKKQGLDVNLLKEIFEHMQSHQFVPSGERDGIRAELKKIIQKNLSE